MIDSTGFADAALALSSADSSDAELCGAFVTWFGSAAAAVSTLGHPLGSEIVCATDAHAAQLDEIQLDLGEGPCWEALATGRPVLEPDLQNGQRTTWPLARDALQKTGIGAVFAFPLVVAGINVGAVDLYSPTARKMSRPQVREATLLSSILARQVLRRALRAAKRPEDDDGAWESEFSRREVHQATGMVLAQMGISAEDALLVLRGHAFATGRPARDVATDVIDRKLDFTEPTD